MKYEIGHRVRFLEDNNSLNRYIILATKDQNLNTNFLNSKTGKFSIKNIETLAKNELIVANGMDYLICKEDEFLSNGNSVLIGNYISVNEEDIII